LATSATANVRTAQSSRRDVGLGEIASAILIVAAFILIQVLIGGTRLLFSFPAYAILSLASLAPLISLLRAKPSPDPRCLWASVVFFGYILARALLSPVPYLARADIYSVLAALVLYFTIALFLTSARLRLSMFVALIIFALAHVFIGLIQSRYGDNFMPISFLQRFDYGHRASGFYVCPNHLAGFLEVAGIMGLSLVFWSRWPTWAKLLVGYAVAMCYLGVLLSASRGGFLSMCASLLLFALLSAIVLKQAGRRTLWPIAGAGFIALLVAGAAVAWLIYSNPHLQERANFRDTNWRVELWQSALQEWQLQPLLGTGSGTYLYYGRRFRPTEMQLDPIYPHNDYLHLLAEYGLVGGLLFLGFLAVHLFNGWRNFRRLGVKRVAHSFRLASNNLALQIGALCAVAAYMVHSVVDFNLHIPANALLLAFVFGMLANAGAPGTTGQSGSARFFLGWRLVAPALAIVLTVQCIRLLPGEYFTERARRLWSDDNPAEAITYALRALEKEKQNPDLYDYLGRARTDLAETISEPRPRESLYFQAIEDFEKGRALAPLDKTFPLELAFVYDALARFPEAEWMFYEARALDPKSATTERYYQAHLLRWSGRATELPPEQT
jgi:O-antigen ligase